MLERGLGMRLSFKALHPSLNLMPSALRRCTLHQFSKGNIISSTSTCFINTSSSLKGLGTRLSTIGLQRNRVYCWKWSSTSSASVQNRVQISVHSPVHESSPESRVQVLHLPLSSAVRATLFALPVVNHLFRHDSQKC